MSTDRLYAGKTVVNKCTKNAARVAAAGQGLIGAVALAEDLT